MPQGAKNEALQVISATLLTAEKVKISNIPDILDVQRLIHLLEGLGSKVERLDKNTYTFEASEIDMDYFASDEYLANAKKIRGSVMLIAPLLVRCKKHSFQNRAETRSVGEDWTHTLLASRNLALSLNTMKRKIIISYQVITSEEAIS